VKKTFLAFVCLAVTSPLAACEKKPSAAKSAATTQQPAQAAAPEGGGTRAADPTKQAAAPSAAPLFDAVAGAIGGLRTGMSRSEAQKIMPLSADPSGQMGDNVAVAGPYRLVFDAKNALSSVEYNVTQSGAGVRIGGATVAPTADRAVLANAIGGCSAPVVGEGGEQTGCAGGRAMIKVGRSCAKKDARGACAEWTDAKRDVLLQLFAAPAATLAGQVTRAQCEAALAHVFDITKGPDAEAAKKLRRKLDVKVGECERDATPAELACVLAARDPAGLRPCGALSRKRQP